MFWEFNPYEKRVKADEESVDMLKNMMNFWICLSKGGKSDVVKEWR